MGVENSFVDVGPVFFPKEVEAVDQVAGEPFLPYFGPGLILLRVIDGGEPA